MSEVFGTIVPLLPLQLLSHLFVIAPFHLVLSCGKLEDGHRNEVLSTVRSCLSVVCIILLEYGTLSQAQIMFSN